MEENGLLKKLHEVELSILKDFDSYCRRYNINYSLYAGTMLGAVRHGGFIPWDDDIDVAMTRVEYGRFRRCLIANPMHGYYFENYIDDYTCGTAHGKLRKENTLFLQEGDIENIGRHEIWLDIFPLDKVPNTKGKNKTKNTGRRIVLFTRANISRSTDTLLMKLARRAIRVIPSCYRHRLLVQDTEWLEQECDRCTSSYEWTSMSTLNNIKSIRFPDSICEKYIDLDFAGYKFMAFAAYSEMLTILYGDYMTLPRVEDRVCCHMPVKVKM